MREYLINKYVMTVVKGRLCAANGGCPTEEMSILDNLEGRLTKEEKAEADSRLARLTEKVNATKKKQDKQRKLPEKPVNAYRCQERP